MEPARLRLGELLVDARIITREQLEEVLDLQRQDGRRLGTLLVEQGWVNETQLTQILSQQLAVPWVSLYHVDFSKRLLNLIPTHVAQKYCLVPIYVRHVRGQGDTLYVAMDDPTNLDALRECASWSGLPTRAMIASPSDIQRTVEIYYGGPASEVGISPATVREGAERRQVEEPPESEPVAVLEEKETEKDSEVSDQMDGSETPAQSDSQSDSQSDAQSDDPSRIAEEAVVRAARSRDSIHEVDVDEDVAPAVEAAIASIPKEQSDEVSVEIGAETTLEEVLGRKIKPVEAQPDTQDRRSKLGKMLSLTLLDGTTLALPMRPREKRARGSLVGDALQDADSSSSPVETQESSVADMLKLLRATAHGAESEPPKWEALMAALMAILLRKGLITEEELIEEIRKL